MAAELQIQINGIPLDLLVGESDRFYITKQLFSLENLENRKAAFSKSLNIPLTPTNKELLGINLPSKARFNTLQYTNIDCDVLVSGVPMIQDSYLIIGAQDIREDTVSITVYGGTAKFFHELSSESIQALDFSSLNIDWTLAGVQTIVNNTSGIVYPNAQWYTNRSYRLYQFSDDADDAQTYLNFMELGETGFFIFVKTIMDKIFSNMPLLTIDDSQIVGNKSPLYEAIAMAVNVPYIHESFQQIDGSYSEVRNDTLVLTSFVNPTPTKITFPTIIDNTSNFWSVANQRYEFIANGFFQVTFHCSGFYRSTASMNYTLVKNGTDTIASDIIPPTSGGQLQTFDGFLVTSINVVNGDFIEIFYTLTFDLAEANFISSGFVVEQTGSGRPLTLDVSALLPDISQRQFVKNVFNHLAIIPSELNNIVTLTYFENIRGTTLGKELLFDTSRPIKLITSFPFYGQTNDVKYIDNENLERLDADDTFPVDSQALRTRTTAVELIFAACDLGDTMGGSNTRCSIPKYDINYNFVNDNKMMVTQASTGYSTTERNSIEAGDFVAYDDGGTWIKRRVVTVTSDFGGLFATAAPSTNNGFDWHHWRYEEKELLSHFAVIEAGALQTISDGGVDTGQITMAVARFPDSMLWRELLKTHYRLITDSMKKPFAFEAWAIIPVADFASLDELDVIYVGELGSHFYINVIAQWKRSKLCRITLIQLNL